MPETKHHSLLPREAQDALIAAAAVGETQSPERTAAVKVAAEFARQKAPGAFKPTTTARPEP